MRKQVKQWGTVKYSETIVKNDSAIEVDVSTASIGMMILMDQGFVTMRGLYVSEITKLIEALQVLEVEYTVRTFRVTQDKTVMDYEFTLPHFEDDRMCEKETAQLAQQFKNIAKDFESMPKGN